MLMHIPGSHIKLFKNIFYFRLTLTTVFSEYNFVINPVLLPLPPQIQYFMVGAYITTAGVIIVPLKPIVEADKTIYPSALQPN